MANDVAISDALQEVRERINSFKKSYKKYFSGKLDLSGLHLSTTDFIELIPELRELKWLRSLNLSNNKITELPPEIGTLTKLTDLDLSKNQIKVIPPEIGVLTKLKSLDLSQNAIETIPSNIGTLRNLKVLFLNNNQIATIPIEIGKLKKLVFLSLHENQLKTLPSEIGKLKKLVFLSLHENQLKTLPSEIGKLKKLIYLFLKDNKLKTLPPEIGELKSLICLFLNNNKIKTIPSEIGKLKKLKTLDLTNNEIETIPTEIRKLKRLNSLYIYRNPITTETKDFLAATFPEEGPTEVYLISISAEVLQILHPQKSEDEILDIDSKIVSLSSKKDFEDGCVPSNKLNGLEVVDGFLERIYDDETNRGNEVTAYYYQATRHLISSVLDTDIETCNATLNTLASSIGNCTTPVNDLLEQTVVRLTIDQGREITSELKAILYRQAFEDAIKKAKISLGDGDPIEAMNGLTNALFLEHAEIYPKNPIKIAGKRTRLPPKNEKTSIDFAFNLVNKSEIGDKFAKLCCQTDQEGEGNLVINDQGQYLLDTSKYMCIVEKYMKGLGVFSEREKAIASCIQDMQKLMPRDFITEYFNDDEVSKLIDWPEQEQKLREILAKDYVDLKRKMRLDSLYDFSSDETANNSMDCPKLVKDLEKIFLEIVSLNISIITSDFFCTYLLEVHRIEERLKNTSELSAESTTKKIPNTEKQEADEKSLNAMEAPVNLEQKAVRGNSDRSLDSSKSQKNNPYTQDRITV